MAPRLPGIGAHHSANPQTDEWLTPPEIIDALGPFDLDPCAPHQRPDWTRCTKTYTVADDGLTLPWEGSVWCNRRLVPDVPELTGVASVTPTLGGTP